MKNERVIEKDFFLHMLKNISPKSYFLCGKCNSAIIDAPELYKFMDLYLDDLFYNDDQDYVRLANSVDSILGDIIGWEPYNADLKEFEERYSREVNKFYGNRLFPDDWLEAEDYNIYFLYENGFFYTTDKCQCYLTRNGLDSIYKVHVKASNDTLKTR